MFEIRTIAESSARSVITVSRRPNCSVSERPGQSPGARTSGRFEKPANPGTASRPRRTAATVAAARFGLASSRRSASAPAPRSPLSAATVLAGA